jgi:hypothetical protein
MTQLPWILWISMLIVGAPPSTNETAVAAFPSYAECILALRAESKVSGYEVIERTKTASWIKKNADGTVNTALSLRCLPLGQDPRPLTSQR